MIGQSIGKYRITRQIGEGGMGAVYEAVHETIGQHVAVKVLHPAYSTRPELVNRFFNEARAVNIVRHAGLVKTFDFGQMPDGSAYMTMELLEGQTLSSRIQRAGTGLPLTDALRIARQVASALCATHHHGIVHRDLKPDNIFLSDDPESAGGERAKILDFGIAKVRSESGGGQAGPQVATSTGALMGTPMYMSPEQCRGAGGVDDRTDVYALGVILYQMLAGKPPFVSDAPGELMLMHMTREPAPLQQAAPRVPEGVTALVHRMLVKTPAERPAIAEVVAVLEQLGAERAHTGPDLAGVGGPAAKGAVSQVRSTLGGANGTRQPRTLVLTPRTGILGGGALVLLLGAGAGLWALLPHRAPPVRKDPSPVTAPISQPPPQPERVRCSVTSQPDGAKVLLLPDHSFLGVTPWSTRQARGNGRLNLLLQLEGHAEQQVTLDPAGHCQQEVQLAALPPAPAEAKEVKETSAGMAPAPGHRHHATSHQPSTTTDGPTHDDYVPKALH